MSKIKNFVVQDYDKTRLIVKRATLRVPMLLDGTTKIDASLKDIASDFKRLTTEELKASDFYNQADQVITATVNIGDALREKMNLLLNDTLERILLISDNSQAFALDLEEAQNVFGKSMDTIAGLGSSTVSTIAADLGTKNIEPTSEPTSESNEESLSTESQTEETLQDSTQEDVLEEFNPQVEMKEQGGIPKTGGGDGGSGSPSQTSTPENRTVAVEGSIPDTVAGIGALEALTGSFLNGEISNPDISGIPLSSNAVRVSNEDLFGVVDASLNTGGIRNATGDVTYQYGAEITGELGLPRYFQDNPEYKGQSYGMGNIESSGCGITSAAMVIAGVTKDPSVTPATLAEQFGSYTGYNSNVDRMEQALSSYGINYTKVNDSSALSQAFETLDNGGSVICSVSKGSNWGGGLSQHLTVISGKTADGKYIVNDPYSWDYNNNCYKYYPEQFQNGFTEQEIRSMWGGGWLIPGSTNN